MNLMYLLSFIPMLLVAMTVHEAAHALMGHWLGDDTAKREGRLSLNPLVHIDPIFTVLVPAVMIVLGIPPILAAKPVPFSPWNVRFGEYGAALIAVAGPLSNLLLAIVAGAILRLINGGLATDLVEFFITINISLALFNLIPWPPLDGSRVLYAFAPDAVRRIMDTIESLGIMGLFIFIFLAYQFISPVVLSVEKAIMTLLL